MSAALPVPSPVVISVGLAHCALQWQPVCKPMLCQSIACLMGITLCLAAEKAHGAYHQALRLPDTEALIRPLGLHEAPPFPPLACKWHLVRYSCMWQTYTKPLNQQELLITMIDRRQQTALTMLQPKAWMLPAGCLQY